MNKEIMSLTFHYLRWWVDRMKPHQCHYTCRTLMSHMIDKLETCTLILCRWWWWKTTFFSCSSLL